MTKLITLVYFIITIFWLVLTFSTGHTAHQAGLYMQITLFLISFVGAVVGLRNAKLWGGFTSVVGKAVFFISLGVLTWSFGMLVWNYYIFIAGVEVPYPSMADVLFILSWPLWAIGVVYLSKATGVKFALRRVRGKVSLLLVPLMAIVSSYYILIEVARGGISGIDSSSVLKLFFDLFYPIGTAVILALALTFFALSINFLGGRYKAPIVILIVAFLVNYLADFTFSFTTTNETYFNGHFVDFLFLTAMYLLAVSLSMLSPADRNKKGYTLQS